ncbi:MAG: phospho-sugar mutase, partial [Flavobacteriales bacterium]
YDSRNNSRLFAETAAKVLLGNEFEVFLFSELRPTPELSFAVRELNCVSGIVITASHNPPEYNGYKVYWEDGAQIIAPHDSGIISQVRSISNPSEVSMSENLDGVVMLGFEMDKKFTAEARKQQLRSDLVKKHADMKIVFTSLHGTGGQLVPGQLREMGFSEVHEVVEQAMPNGDFPTVESPNPEEKSAMKMALELADKIDAELVMGTDPDADRVGIGVRNHQGELILLNGNETGALLVYYYLKNLTESKQMPNAPFIAKTIVSSDLISAIGKRFEVPVYNTLTGFKYIAALIRAKEGKEKFIVGGEESYGYMCGDFVRDKDAVTAAIMICEMAAWAKETHGSVYAFLEAIHKECGLYLESLISVKKDGSAGKKEIAAMMDQFRKTPPASLGGVQLEYMDDVNSGERIMSNGAKEKLDLPVSNVIQFRLKNGSLVTARPSGTEPKIKFYFSVCTEYNDKLSYEDQKQELLDQINALSKELLD